MAEENQNDQAAQQGAEGARGQLSIQKIFVKDASFEVPNAPQIFRENGQAEVNLNLAQKVNQLDDNSYEVVLTVTVTAKMGEQTAYLAEVQQGGIFSVEGFEQNQLHPLLGSYCPQVLFPYARSAISDLVGQGGFPPLVLQHVDFNAIYAQQLQRQQEQAAQGGEQQTAH